MKLSTKFALVSVPLLIALIALLVFVAGSGSGADASSLGAVWFSILCIVSAGGLLSLFAQSVITRLGAVAERASDLATVELPSILETLPHQQRNELLSETVPGRDGADEISGLEASLDAVQGAVQSAVRGMTVSQDSAGPRCASASFVAIVERNSVLLDRQLALLDRLEDDAEDSMLLAEYYQLDHLASQMRRNAVSLLVLAGAPTQQRSATPVGIADVVRAGISEIRDYQRVGALSIAEADVRGPVVGDLAHMLAELFDNAASYSSADTYVTVAGKMVAGGYLISIRDRGVGLGADNLAALNGLLTQPSAGALADDSNLGLTVVSLLAEKHGVTVEVQAADVGTNVDLLLPATIFETTERPEAQINPQPDASVDPFPFGGPPQGPMAGTPQRSISAAEASRMNQSLPLPPTVAPPSIPAASLDPLLRGGDYAQAVLDADARSAQQASVDTRN